MMRKAVLSVITAALISAGPMSHSRAGTINMTVDAGGPGKQISQDLIGIFFEDLSYAGDGGLYAELIQNRSFEFSATEQPDWNNLSFWSMSLLGGAKGQVVVEKAWPVHPNNPHYAVLRLEVGDGVTLSNSGYERIPLQAGQRYELSLFARHLYAVKDQPRSGALPLVVRLEGPKGDVLAESTFQISNTEWQRFAVTLAPTRAEPAARLVLLAKQPGGIALDEVSLFPTSTFRNRPNGLRADLAQAIADLKPKFIRFPGGCLVHGDGIDNMYRWKDTIGPIEQRQQQANIWRYHQTMGLGYYEYFQFAEDIGAEPLPVVPAGVCCQNSDRQRGAGQRGLPMETMEDYVQEVLDLIEYANGPVTSKWGAKRAVAGHPEPFNLKYVGVGNEDHITFLFKERFRMIYEAIKKKHPEITVVGTVGAAASGEDYDRGWKIADELKVPMVDEHYYMTPDWFWDNLSRYDSYDRSKSQVYLGEYAAHDPSRRYTLRAALSEAAYLTSLERNGDIVRMASYAPLLGREGFLHWNPNLIYFNADPGVYPTVSYDVQRLFSHNAGDRYLSSMLSGLNVKDRLAVSAVRDSASGDLILKIVNGDEISKQLQIAVKGGGKLSSTAALTVLAGKADDTNDYAKKTFVRPKASTIAVSSDFSYSAPASSLTVLRIPARSKPQPNS